MSKNIDLNQPLNKVGDNYAHYACMRNNEKIVRFILQRNYECFETENERKKKPIDLAKDIKIRVLI